MPRAVLLLVAFAASACGAMYASGEEPTTWQRFTRSQDLDGAVVGDAPDRATVAIVFASWCGHCRREMDELADLMARRQDVRVIGVNFRHHEEYDQRGDSAAVRAFVREEAPWLRVVPGDLSLWQAFGGPRYVPALYVFAADGSLAASFDREHREPPDADELDALLTQLRDRNAT